MASDHPFFISYSHKDVDLVRHIVNEVNQQLGISCWIDLEGIDCTDAAFREDIIQAIDASDIVLFMLSKHSMQSAFTKKEVLYAREIGKKVLPIRIDDSEMRGWFLFEFAEADIIDYRNPLQMQRFYRNVRSLLGRKTSPAPVIQQETEKTQVTENSVPKKKSKAWLFVLLPVLLIALGGAEYYFLPQFSILHPTPNQPQKTELPTQQPEGRAKPAQLAQPVKSVKPAQQPEGRTLDYAVWTGKNGSETPLDGVGKLMYTKGHLIDSRDVQRRQAQKGDVIEGLFKDGHLVYGTWYDAQGKKKDFINIGQ